MSDSTSMNSEFVPTAGVHNLSLAVQAALDEDLFHRLAESLTDYGIVMLDAKGNITSLTTGAELMTGYTTAEVVGRHIAAICSDDGSKQVLPAAQLELARNLGRFEEEGWRLRRDGSGFWAHSVLICLKGAAGDTLGFTKVMRDLTTQRAVEEALRSSQERARQVCESVKDYALITLDKDGYITGWNEGARRIKGYEAQEIIGQNFSIFYTIDDLKVGRCSYELSEAAASGSFEDEGWRVRKDGTRFWANVVISALFDRKRALRGFSKVTRDITDKSAEKIACE